MLVCSRLDLKGVSATETPAKNVHSIHNQKFLHLFLVIKKDLHLQTTNHQPPAADKTHGKKKKKLHHPPHKPNHSQERTQRGRQTEKPHSTTAPQLPTNPTQFHPATKPTRLAGWLGWLG
jgi:hypothetical protein